MIRLIIFFLVVSAATPFAMNTILPEAQKSALKGWLLSNEMTFVAGVLFGDKEVPDASSPSDFLGALTSLDYSESLDKLKSNFSNVGEETEKRLDGYSGINAREAVEQVKSWGSQATGKTEGDFPTNSWFEDYQFEEKTQVHNVYGSGCRTSGKTIDFNSQNCP